jgi:hypothetical protein
MEVRHMANKKNSAPADEDKVRTAVRRTLKWGLPLTPDDAIEKVREGEQLRAELISSVFFTALASKPAEPKLSDWGAMAFVYQALANADAVDHSVRAGNTRRHNTTTIFYVCCAPTSSNARFRRQAGETMSCECCDAPLHRHKKRCAAAE